MIGRISTWEGSAEQLEGWKNGVLDRVRPMVEKLEGNVGALFLLDREQGRAHTITLWRDEEAAKTPTWQPAEARRGPRRAAAQR